MCLCDGSGKDSYMWLEIYVRSDDCKSPRISSLFFITYGNGEYQTQGLPYPYIDVSQKSHTYWRLLRQETTSTVIILGVLSVGTDQVLL